MWVWVSLPYATFGLRTSDGLVVEAPPIAKWTVGRSDREVAAFYRRKGATFRKLGD